MSGSEVISDLKTEGRQVRACPLCGMDNSAELISDLSRDPWQLKTCGQCGFFYLENPPGVEALQTDLAWEKTSRDETARRKAETPVATTISAQVKKFRKHVLARRKLYTILSRMSSPGPVLDVGCGWGHTLEENLPEGFTPWGIEISMALAQRARTRFEARGGKVFQGDAVTNLRRLEPNTFHAVTLIAILEHVEDPVALLSAVRPVLISGGIVVIKVPNYASLNRRLRGRRWCGLRFPDHVNYFTPESLSRCAARAELEVARFGLLDRQPTSDNMWCVLRRAR